MMKSKFFDIEKAIKKLDKQKKKYDKSQTKVEQYFKDLIKEDLANAKTKEDFIKIKERLRPMPDMAGKVLLFRTIILTEESLCKHVNTRENIAGGRFDECLDCGKTFGNG